MDKAVKKVDVDKLMKDDAFCVIPWIHMHPWPDGRVFTCCLSELHTPVGNLNKESLEEVWNSETMKQFRLDLLNGKKISNCNRCYEQEEHGHETLRIRSNQEYLTLKNNPYGNKKVHVVESTNEDGSVDTVNMTYMDIRFLFATMSFHIVPLRRYSPRLPLASILAPTPIISNFFHSSITSLPLYSNLLKLVL